MAKQTIEHLRELQALPLSLKVRLTQQRIREWVNHYGTDGVYVSFSGGKDSTVLLHIVRGMYGDKIPGVFVDTGLEYPEIRDFVKTYENIVWLKPKKNFRDIIKDYGYPFIGKEVAERVHYAQRYLSWYEKNNGGVTGEKEPTQYGLTDLLGLRTHEHGVKNDIRLADEVIQEFIDTGGRGTYKLKQLYGISTAPDGKPAPRFNFVRWKTLAICPYPISDQCCDVMKKAPTKKYGKESGRVPITAQMTCESRLRQSTWLQVGCNAFDAKKPVSNPMSFWLEQDVLRYLKENNIPIAKPYGEIVKDDEVAGQMDLADFGIMETGTQKLKTTGCKRTGCVFCGFGCHLEEEGNGRFLRLKQTHPKLYQYIMKPWDEGGLGYKEVIDWINEHCNVNIEY
jgi:3'-phosphoadenosine 5'-phosphosulfate sulfotransferase (PAPS reductase)/FAD synthetase